MRYAPTDEEFRARIAAFNEEERQRANGHAEVLSMHSGARLDAQPEAKPRLRLIPFDEIKLGTESRYLVKGIIPRFGLVIVWGPPKCGKSFWMFDVAMHVALGWQYRDRRVQQGAAVYCAFEGQKGLEARVEAFRQTFPIEIDGSVPFYLQPVTLDLVADHHELIATIKRQMTAPALVVLDTLNRSLRGSENDSKDMAAYIAAADAIRETFDCVVVIVHHCGIDGSRPRGSTALSGAADAQLSVTRDASDAIIVEVEFLKDGAASDIIASRLKPVDVGKDVDGETISSCVVTPADAPKIIEAGPKLTKNQQTMYSILRDAGQGGLTADQWNERLREVGIGTKRKADIYDARAGLKAKNLVREFNGRWNASE
jgi:AAA domain-containing protein